MTSIDITIDELDLSAVDPARRFQVAATFETELARLVRTRGTAHFRPRSEPLSDRPGARPAEPLIIKVSPAGNPVHLGLALARSVFESLS
jgi:hypothetical protein